MEEMTKDELMILLQLLDSVTIKVKDVDLIYKIRGKIKKAAESK